MEQENDIAIQVIDNGIGLDTDAINQIMTSNSVVSRRGTAKEKGSGLGLMICKEFIERNNGNFIIKCKENIQTVVSFTLKKLGNN